VPRGKKEDRPEQNELPGIEKKIKEIHEKGLQYAAVRDERMQLTQQEVKLQGELLELMKKHELTRYQVEDVEMEIVPVKERVKVRIKKDEEEEKDAA
jgi:hypothetical protein